MTALVDRMAATYESSGGDIRSQQLLPARPKLPDQAHDEGAGLRSKNFRVTRIHGPENLQAIDGWIAHAR